MEVDNPNHQSTWLINQAKSAASIYEARSWLLTAKNAAPALFSVQFAAYELELKDKVSPLDASNILFQLAKNNEFENETRLWEEVELVLNSEADPFRQRILKEYSDKQHRDLIASCAIKQKHISKNIALMLKLLEKWPDQISQLGPQMAENLLQEEKKLQSQFPPEEQSCLNECRRILIAEVLPIITNSASLSSLQPKSFYKWFQKAIEFTTVYTTNSALVGRMGDKYKMSEPWERLKKLRQAIGKKCDWSEEKNCGSLLEQVKWVRLQKSRKQIFYTAGHLHLEATVRYMTLSEAQLIIPSDNESLSVFPMLNIFAKSKSIGGLRVEPLELKLGKSIELFDAASESYKILTSPGDKNIESCHKDWTHLEKRWKVTNWLWHRLFLVDRLIKDNAFDSAITSLSNLMKLPHFPPRLAVRCRAQLGCCYYGNKKIKSAVRPMLECLSLLYAKNPHIDDNECNLARPGRINWIKAKLSHLLPYTVHVVLQGLEEIVSSVDKDKQR